MKKKGNDYEKDDENTIGSVTDDVYACVMYK